MADSWVQVLHHDFLIVGGGVVGLSIAWELSGRRKSDICIVDRQQFGRATSWVGAGIFPPPLTGAKFDALEQLRSISHRLHPEWSQRLRDETGIDNELRKCGGIYFARDAGEAASLRGAMQWAAEDGVDVETLPVEELVSRVPSLGPIAADVKAAFYLPDEMQLRSPRHLGALVAACEQESVVMRPDLSVQRLEVDRDQVSLITEQGVITAGEVILCSGPWSAELLDPFGLHLPVEPWRGQLILWKTDHPALPHIINEGLRYLVPRQDGHILAGATVEDVGFDSTTTSEATDELREFSYELLPALREHEMVQSFAGLRPKTPDGLPFMGRVPGFGNLSVATGHYRSGLHLSTGTAVFMADLLLHDTPPENATAFRISR